MQGLCFWEGGVGGGEGEEEGEKDRLRDSVSKFPGVTAPKRTDFKLPTVLKSAHRILMSVTGSTSLQNKH